MADVAHLYDDEKRHLDTQAKTGRITRKSAKTQMRELMESEADRLDKVAGDLFHEREVAQAYRTKAKELRDSIPAMLDKVGGTPGERVSLRRVVTAATDRDKGSIARLEVLEKSIANDPTRLPIGMKHPLTATDATKTPALAPVIPLIPTSQMTSEQRAAHYWRLARDARTPDESAVWQTQARKCAETAREERG